MTIEELGVATAKNGAPALSEKLEKDYGNDQENGSLNEHAKEHELALCWRGSCLRCAVLARNGTRTERVHGG